MVSTFSTQNQYLMGKNKIPGGLRKELRQMSKNFKQIKVDAKQKYPAMKEMWSSKSKCNYCHARIKIRAQKKPLVINLFKVTTSEELNDTISRLSFNSNSYCEGSMTQFSPELLVWS